MKITLDMPVISKCVISQCAYNVSNSCHAKAITVGDDKNPCCDTFFSSNLHNREVRRIAGVGACKVTSCKFNSDLECSAEKIDIGYTENQVTCLTYRPA
ncbi:MAG: DUF1540 domain-containing protein [Bdellovibrionota bacterium]